VSGVDLEGVVLTERWRLGRRLGEGGMGAVYAGTHVRNGKRVAVKVLHPGIDGGDVLARFQREGYLANLVDDPGVVAVFDDGITDEGVAYLVMELLVGESIEDRAQRCGGRLPWQEILAIVHPALVTLGKAHAAGVVHRDLKPSNLFLTKAGQIKLLDFGLAGHTGASPGARLTGPMTPTMGTLGFMPAEQAVGDWPNVDARSDLWSMGATMFALATGVCPHESGNDQAFFHRVLTAAAPRLADVTPDAPPSFAAIVDRALLRERAARFSSAEEMAAAVQGAFYELTGEEVAHVSSGAKRLVPSPRHVDLLGEETTLSEASAVREQTPPKVVTLASAGRDWSPEPSLRPAATPSPSMIVEPSSSGGRTAWLAVGVLALGAVAFALTLWRREDAAPPAPSWPTRPAPASIESDQPESESPPRPTPSPDPRPWATPAPAPVAASTASVATSRNSAPASTPAGPSPRLPSPATAQPSSSASAAKTWDPNRRF
jgi:serine/threonine protein kinase